MRPAFHGGALLALFILLPAALVISGCGAGGSQGSEPQSTAATLASAETRLEPSAEAEARIPALVAGNTAFAIDLFKAARSLDDTGAGNLVLSPYSLSLALAMTYAGARGQTEIQMAKVLHFDLPQEQLRAAFNALDEKLLESDAEKLTTAASAWVFPPVVGPGAVVRIRGEYLDLLARNYGAAVYQAPGDTEKARQMINTWAEEATEGLIDEILPSGSLPGEWTALVLANATYLKAAWTYAFPAENTRPAPFYLDNGSSTDVPMMRHFMPYEYAEDSLWAAIDLPCLGDEGLTSRGDISAVFLLPREGSLDRAVAATTAESLQGLLARLPQGGAHPDCIAVNLPRFKFDTAIELKKPLESLGMVDLFHAADLSGAYEPVDGGDTGDPPGIWVDEIYHGGAIAVDEKGIEAAAGTAVAQVAGLGPGEITFDRPFLFIVRHVPTGTVLFMGQVLNPIESAE
ncbi:MAG: serpin family protein [Thermoleophilia bacterium]|nr:serpin family protein [Thermoleophilia bacterium]